MEKILYRNWNEVEINSKILKNKTKMWGAMDIQCVLNQDSTAVEVAKIKIKKQNLNEGNRWNWKKQMCSSRKSQGQPTNNVTI